MDERKVLEVIRKNPGINAYRIGKMLGKHTNSVANCLITLERKGILISEDAYGGLTVFKKNGR